MNYKPCLVTYDLRSPHWLYLCPQGYAPSSATTLFSCLLFDSQFTLYPSRSGWKWNYICRTNTCGSHMASHSPKMSCAITDPGPLAQTLLPEARAFYIPPRAFHSPDLWASITKPHRITSQFSPFSSFELLLKMGTTGINTAWQTLSFWGFLFRLKAKKITQGGAEQSFGLSNCFILAQKKMFKFSFSNTRTCVVPLLNHLWKVCMQTTL